MKKCLVAASAFSLAAILALWSFSAPRASAGEPVTLLARLEAGNARYASGELARAHQTVERRSEVAQGQKPFAVIVGCADSRVPPELVFDQGLGDLFVVRSAGNVLGDATIGSIEYAAEHLGCELVVVLGHERCGAVDAVVKGGELAGHMAAFVPAILPAVATARTQGGDVLDDAVRLNAKKTAAELLLCEPVLSHLVHEGKLAIVSARYDLDTGEVEWLEQLAGHGDGPGEPHASH